MFHSYYTIFTYFTFIANANNIEQNISIYFNEGKWNFSIKKTFSEVKVVRVEKTIFHMRKKLKKMLTLGIELGLSGHASYPF